MELLLFRHDEFDKLYGCEAFNADKIPLEQRTDIVNGCILITLFFFFEILYVPCMVSIYKKMHDNPCYKMLFFIGILDMLALLMNALETGIGIIGAVYCDYPLLIYTTGSMGLSLWFAETAAEFLLAINRCLELLKPELAFVIFNVFTIAMAWMTPNYAGNNAISSRTRDDNNVSQQPEQYDND
ncbi:hypothetical protein niasHT_038373 [Heterodera trifolii]|uniref:G-protein coupled receptors family 1 profile domain-containing protein n=1 Tax=Heterodera trifolii TaxID=157864 RepID=A0ABD2J0N7_9BILA